MTEWYERLPGNPRPDPISGKQKYRGLFEVAHEAIPFVLVSDPDAGDGRVILFDAKPTSDQWPQALKRL